MPFGLTSRFTAKAIVVAVCGGDELGLGFGVAVGLGVGVRVLASGWAYPSVESE